MIKKTLRFIKQYISDSSHPKPTVNNPQDKIDALAQSVKGGGERQASQSLDGIRADHIARYRFAKAYIPKQSRILDMACGVGYGSFIIAQETDCSSILSVDIDPPAIEYAKAHYAFPKITYMEGNCLEVALEPESIDIAISFETIEHIPDDKRLLQRFHSVLTPQGTLILSTPNQILMPYTPQTHPFHVRHYTPEELKLLLAVAGFEIQEVYSQENKQTNEIIEGWEGKFNVLVCKKYTERQ